MTEFSDHLNDRDAADRAMLHALEALELSADLLGQALADLQKRGVDGLDAKLREKIKSVNDAFVLALKTEVAARTAGSERFARDGHGTLDLAAARDEISARLARLRAAGDDQDSPEKPG